MIEKEFFGIADGGEVYSFTLENEYIKVEVINYGGIIKSLVVKSSGKDVVLGYNTLGEYEKDENYFGATIGRCANLIRGGKLAFGGKEYFLTKNYGEDTLHGGVCGFNKRVWAHRTEAETLVLSYFSKDGEEGFPGDLNCEIRFALDKNALAVTYCAVCDKDTVFDPTCHAYFNLNGVGSGDVLSHRVKINADKTGEKKDGKYTGGICKVDKDCDFREERRVVSDCDENYYISGRGLREAARATGDKTGITMAVITDAPCMQFYTGGELTKTYGKSVYEKSGGLCFEPQRRCGVFDENAILKSGERFNSRVVYAFY
ncbi:MAG: galactose mutarotase [Clostridia bacterium]|nr:galactose mutarotase [Clostridia bacterium]